MIQVFSELETDDETGSGRWQQVKATVAWTSGRWSRSRQVRFNRKQSVPRKAVVRDGWSLMTGRPRHVLLYDEFEVLVNRPESTAWSWVTQST